MDDDLLVQRARRGDRQATDELLRAHVDRIYAVCRRLAGNDADAADAMQEALIAIVRGLPKFDGRSAFSTWSHRVATNACLDELRRRKRRPALSLDRDDTPETPATQRAVDADVSDRLTIDAALARLPEDFRTPVVLRDLRGHDYAEIAELLDIPVGTVKSRIARGRAQLAEILGNQSGDHHRRNERHE